MTKFYKILLFSSFLFFVAKGSIKENFENNTKVNCYDNRCLKCYRPEESYCLKCQDEFELVGGKCGEEECSSLPHCKYCNRELNRCYKCKGVCILKGNDCDCVERVVIIVVCVVISLLVIGVVLYCLIKPNSGFGSQQILGINSQLQRGNNPNVLYTNVKSESERRSELIDMFNENKIVLGRGNTKLKCMICKVQPGNVKLSCGCCLCFKDEKDVKTMGNLSECPVCHKVVKDILQVTCGICFANKTEIAKFKCGCAFVVCRDCYVTWRLNHDDCPACRGNIE